MSIREVNFREVRGSPHSHVRESDTHSGLRSTEGKLISFRIVFDGARQRDRGGCWNYAASAVARSFGGEANPAAKVKSMGFRLAKEDM